MTFLVSDVSSVPAQKMRTSLRTTGSPSWVLSWLSSGRMRSVPESETEMPRKTVRCSTGGGYMEVRAMTV